MKLRRAQQHLTNTGKAPPADIASPDQTPIKPTREHNQAEHQSLEDEGASRHPTESPISHQKATPSLQTRRTLGVRSFSNSLGQSTSGLSPPRENPSSSCCGSPPPRGALKSEPLRNGTASWLSDPNFKHTRHPHRGASPLRVISAGSQKVKEMNREKEDPARTMETADTEVCFPSFIQRI